MSTQKLKSEQLPTDGSFQLKERLATINQFLKDNGKHGKTATIKVSGQALAVQFSFNGQQQKGVNERFSFEGLEKAKRIALLVSAQLEAGTYTHEWLNELLGKKPKQSIETSQEPEKKKTCKELLAEYKTWWFKEKTSLKTGTNKSWFHRQRWLDALESIDKPLTDKIIQDVILSTTPNSADRGIAIRGVKNFLDFHCIDYPKFLDKLQKENKPKPSKKYIPTDSEIEQYLQAMIKREIEGQHKSGGRKTNMKARQKITFIYKLLAIYGLRIHEVFQIANWDKPVTLKNGDWVTVDVSDDDESSDSDTMEQYQGEDFVIPAINSINNSLKILAIKNDTKTGYRMAMPLSPTDKDWLKEWDLIRNCPIEELLPNWKFPKEGKTSAICGYFRLGTMGGGETQYSRNNRFIPFTPHALRHAYNHRGHNQGINQAQLAQSLGHSIEMNGTTYFDTMREETKLQGLKNAFKQELNKVDRVTELEAEVKALKLENERLKQELLELKVKQQLEHHWTETEGYGCRLEKIL
ncbi:hypothetical protein [Gloeothece verrucosa]|uniref:Integrase family protein n=1 Tax=Gloeothece verrucosa (strain PCC 7822) TaxID=497965 RepID=E0UI46_GLOV7|nr:hypothetical protein [Gloeothece verrucosa]ADN15698.1 hypothetical protein Cyan7822_3762 [Gloeothece verrucosa PCC 7822]